MTGTLEREEIIGKINEFLAEEFEVDKEVIQSQANLKEALDLDSLDYVDLVVEIESNFGFKVNPEDFMTIETFQNFYDYVIDKVEAHKS